MKVLLLVNNTAKYNDLIASVSDAHTEVKVASYKELAFAIDGEKTQITVFPTGEDLKEFSKIIVLSTSPQHLQNYIFSALACYCHKNNITLLDDTFSNTDGKLFALWRFWEKSIPVAKTFFGPKAFLSQKLSELKQGIIKSVQGTKGNDNYLVSSEQELNQIIDAHPETGFILQNFVLNDGDWRIILTNFEPKLAIYRSSHGKDHRNNTSVGGEAVLIPLKDVDPKIIELAINSAKALNIKIAGADIMQDKETGDYTVLEVNRTPQLVTGAFIDEKTAILKDLIRS